MEPRPLSLSLLRQHPAVHPSRIKHRLDKLWISRVRVPVQAVHDSIQEREFSKTEVNIQRQLRAILRIILSDMVILRSHFGFAGDEDSLFREEIFDAVSFLQCSMVAAPGYLLSPQEAPGFNTADPMVYGVGARTKANQVEEMRANGMLVHQFGSGLSRYEPELRDSAHQFPIYTQPSQGWNVGKTFPNYKRHAVELAYKAFGEFSVGDAVQYGLLSELRFVASREKDVRFQVLPAETVWKSLNCFPAYEEVGVEIGRDFKPPGAYRTATSRQPIPPEWHESKLAVCAGFIARIIGNGSQIHNVVPLRRCRQIGLKIRCTGGSLGCTACIKRLNRCEYASGPRHRGPGKKPKKERKTRNYGTPDKA
ncbi:hypothetical protein B0H13DRAFT_1931999 [Mycena leptocephala]|nr:hypothetical protein B0H13DRAFT_1931999 [Mycena leptocephala]